MKKTLVILLMFLLSNTALAGFSGGYVKRVYTSSSGWTYVGLTTQPPDTCSSWGEHFKFDSSTASGKNMLSTLLAAKIAKHGIHVWYTSSTAPGTDQYSGCSHNTISNLTSVGLQ